MDFSINLFYKMENICFGVKFGWKIRNHYWKNIYSLNHSILILKLVETCSTDFLPNEIAVAFGVPKAHLGPILFNICR